MTQASRPEGMGHNDGRPQPLATAPVPPAHPVPPDKHLQRSDAQAPTSTVDKPTGAEPAVRRSRFGGLWVGLIVAAVVLVLLLVFILQNSQTVQVDYFGFSGQLPVAVAILLGVAAGALLVAIPGTVRILQLRRTARRH